MSHAGLAERVSRAWERFKEALGQKPEGQTVDLRTADELSIASSMRAKLTTDWSKLTGEEAIDKLADYARRHEEMLEQLAVQLDTEKAERKLQTNRRLQSEPGCVKVSRR